MRLRTPPERRQFGGDGGDGGGGGGSGAVLLALTQCARRAQADLERAARRRPDDAPREGADGRGAQAEAILADGDEPHRGGVGEGVDRGGREAHPARASGGREGDGDRAVGAGESVDGIEVIDDQPRAAPAALEEAASAQQPPGVRMGDRERRAPSLGENAGGDEEDEGVERLGRLANKQEDDLPLARAPSRSELVPGVRAGEDHRIGRAVEALGLDDGQQRLSARGEPSGAGRPGMEQIGADSEQKPPKRSAGETGRRDAPDRDAGRDGQLERARRALVGPGAEENDVVLDPGGRVVDERSDGAAREMGGGIGGVEDVEDAGH